jgi:drug/metabolite transporter (DMT)-like permease
MASPAWRHWALLFYLVIFWGFAFGLIAIGLEGFHPVTVVWARLGLGAVVMWAVFLARAEQFPRQPIWLWRMAALSMLGNLLPFSLIAWAEQSVPSGQAGMLMALMPITTLIMGHYFLSHEKLTVPRVLGVALGLAGVSLILGDDLWQAGSPERLWGQLAILVATIAYAANGIYTKRLPAIHPVTVTAGSLTVGTVLLTPCMLYLQGPVDIGHHLDAVGAVLLLGVFATGVATWVYFIVVLEVGPGFLSTINYLIPGMALLFGIVVLAEPAGLLQLAALVLILLGVWLIQPRTAAVD